MRSKNRMPLIRFRLFAVSALPLTLASALAQTIAATVPLGAGPGVAKICRRRNIMRRIYTNLLPIALFLLVVPTALASTTWYVDGVNGEDNNNCETAQSACETIGHAISLAGSGDSIIVAAAIYGESLDIAFSLNVIGSGASTTIIDGQATRPVMSI